MGDRPPGDHPAAPIPPPPDPNVPANPLNQRTFFSSVAAGDFFDQLQVVLERQHAQTLAAQEVFVTKMNEPVVALTGLVEKLLAAMPVPRPPVPPGYTQSPPPPVPPRPSSTPPVSPYHSRPPPRGPPPPVTPPVRETTAFTFATADTTTSSNGVSGIKLPMFNGLDGENVVAWLNQLDRFFRLKNITKDDKKVDLASFSITGDARSFFHHCCKLNNEVELTWDEFQHAFLQKYERASRLGKEQSLAEPEVSSVRASRADTLLGQARRFPSRAGLQPGSGTTRLCSARKARSQLGNYIM